MNDHIQSADGKAITRNTYVTLGAAMICSIAFIGGAVQIGAMLERQKNTDRTQTLAIELLQKEMELRTDDRWKKTDHKHWIRATEYLNESWNGAEVE